MEMPTCGPAKYHAAHVVHGFSMSSISRARSSSKTVMGSQTLQHRVAHGADAQDGHGSPFAGGCRNVLTVSLWWQNCADGFPSRRILHSGRAGAVLPYLFYSRIQ